MPKSQEPQCLQPSTEALTTKELVDEVNYLRAENAYLKKLEALAHKNKQSVRLKKP
jgi:transposase